MGGVSPLQDLPCTLELRQRLDALEAVRATRRAILSRCSEVQGLTRRLPLDKSLGRVGLQLCERGQKSLPGLSVEDIAPEGQAERAGIQRGDVLLSVNGAAVTSPEHAATLVDEAERRAATPPPRAAPRRPASSPHRRLSAPTVPAALPY